MNEMTDLPMEAIFDQFDSIFGQESLEKKERKKQWISLISNLPNNPPSSRAALMFMPDILTDYIWAKKDAASSNIVYLPFSKGIPEGISIQGNLKEGALYVIDPRNDHMYYHVDEIARVLINDHLLEMKSIFERLGAIQLDISFVQEDDDNKETIHSNGQKIKASYGVHSGSVSHECSGKSKSKNSKYYQLEIHKKLKGKKAEIDWEKYYWFKMDKFFESEIDSILEGFTKEVNIREVSKSYLSQSSMNLHKIEAEYSYLESIGIAGEVNWSKESLSELSKSTIWDVHVVMDD